jgi:hypothetical protein
MKLEQSFKLSHDNHTRHKACVSKPSNLGFLGTASCHPHRLIQTISGPRRVKSAALMLILVASLPFLTACNSHLLLSGHQQTTLAISPSQAILSAGQSTQLNVTISGASNSGLSWNISPAGLGSITSTGLYTAPTSVTAQQVASITATSQADGSQTATTSITIIPDAIAIVASPTAASLSAGQTQQFTAQVENVSNSGVTWSIGQEAPGTISSTGLYTAPAIVSTGQDIFVTATSVADSTVSATSVVTLKPTVINVAPSSATLQAGQIQQFQVSVNSASNLSVVWEIAPAGTGSIDASGLYTAPASITSVESVSITATSLLDSSIQGKSTITLSLPSRTAPQAGLITASYFGVTNAANAAAHPWPIMPVGVMRTFDSQWWKIEPAQDQWQFAVLDSDVNLAMQNNADVEFVLGTTPTWASARPDEAPGYPNGPSGDRAEPADLSTWINYVQTLALRYKGRVHTYECWNEPDNPPFYSGDMSHMVGLCSAAYSALKAVDPHIQLTSPSLADCRKSDTFLVSYLQQGGKGTFDALSCHLYPGSAEPEVVVPWVSNVQAQLTQAGLAAMPVWNTETGYYIASGPNATEQFSFPAGAYVLDSRTSQEYVSRFYLLGAAIGLSRNLWYAWGLNDYALVDDGGRTEKPATIAYQVVMQWLLNTTVVAHTRDSAGNWTLQLASQNGQLKYIVWNDQTESASMVLPLSWKISSAVDVNGNQIDIVSGELPTSGMPVLLQ